MTAATVAAEHYRRQVDLARQIADDAGALWGRFDPARLDLSWARAIDQLLGLLVGAQTLAAADADGYLDEILAAQHIDPFAAGRVNPRALAGVASDGRDLTGLLYEPVIATKAAIGQGSTIDRAMVVGRISLDLITRTQLADAGRVGVGVGIVARPKVGGFVRMLSPPSCSRCIILAGKWYRYNRGFTRHPRCDCRHIPTTEDRAGDLRTNARGYFDGLSPAEQDRLFTRAGAQAIRDGANVDQVVNARRGMATSGTSETRVRDDGFVVNVHHKTRTTTQVFGRDVSTTTEGVTRRGLAGQRLGARTGARTPRLMPEQIYADAIRLGLDRPQTLEVLRRHGYIL